LEDRCHTAILYLKKLLLRAENTFQNLWISYSPIFPEEPNALYFPDSKSAFLIRERDYSLEMQEKEYHYINMDRFIKKEEIHLHKQKLRFGKKCCDTLYDGARDAFTQAYLTHQELEKYYVNAMDFLSYDKMCDKVVDELFETR
jgi:hypothetical protein